ncbi:MAG: hypothetical protein KDM63_05810 [Verrucomicrobiae bacterium]|nr:hypothetical protein [Verrucomicrobiae bacterium]
MISVETIDQQIHLTFPTDGMEPEEVNDFVRWLQAEAVARRSRLTEAEAAKLADEINRDWWQKNRERFIPADAD